MPLVSACFKKNTLVWQRLKRYWPVLLVPLAWWLTQEFGYAVNLSQSLPQKVWLIAYKKCPQRGDYVLFQPPLKSDVPRDTAVIKQVLGIPGDRVNKLNQDFFINDKYVLTAKKTSLQGEPLKPGPIGILSEEQYFIASLHKDSLDSRYDKMGWITQNQIIGVAYPLW